MRPTPSQTPDNRRRATHETMRFGRNVEVRPLGGGFGCLLMILFSVVASVLLTVVANLLLN
jgi:hypothetical protein